MSAFDGKLIATETMAHGMFAPDYLEEDDRSASDVGKLVTADSRRALMKAVRSSDRGWRAPGGKRPRQPPRCPRGATEEAQGEVSDPPDR